MTAGITTGTQIGVASPTALPQDSRIVGYDKELRMKSLPEDIYTDVSGVYNPNKQQVPDAIYMKVDQDASDAGVEAVITMKLRLRGGAVYGNDFAIGAEERPTTRSLKIFCNNLRKVVEKPGYGRRELEAKGYKLYEKHVDDLAEYDKEHHGVEIRMSVLEQFGETLLHGDTAADCVQNWNPNMFVCGLGPASVAAPTFSEDKATYTANLVQKILDSGGGSFTPVVRQTLGQANLSHLQNMAIERRITPISIPGLPGGKGWILTISELQAMYLGDPAWSTANLGSLYIAFNRLDEKVQHWSGVLGAYKNMLIVVDPRQPTLLGSGSSEPYGVTAGYLWMGDVDERHRDDPMVADTAFLLGKASVIDWTPQKLAHIKQDDDYGAIEGHGTQVVRGLQQPIFRNTTKTTHEQFSSIVAVCRLPQTYI